MNTIFFTFYCRIGYDCVFERKEVGFGREMCWGMETADALWEGHKLLKTGVSTDRQTDRQTDTHKWKQYIRQFHSVHLADMIMELVERDINNKLREIWNQKSHKCHYRVNNNSLHKLHTVYFTHSELWCWLSYMESWCSLWGLINISLLEHQAQYTPPTPTRRNCRVSSRRRRCIHTADTTKLFCRVSVGGVNTIRDDCRRIRSTILKLTKQTP